MIITKQFVKELILEELTKADVKKMIDDAVEKSEKRNRKEFEKKELSMADVRKEVDKMLEKMLKSKDTKSEFGDIAKELLKKLYKDLSMHHPYIIDRIKV
jgi:uncharacterized membrane protein YheB (UPF0754 family)